MGTLQNSTRTPASKLGIWALQKWLDLWRGSSYFTGEMGNSQTFSEELLDRLRSSRSLTVLTGAGVSAESGVPTFRGKDGLWRKFSPQELATMDAFMRNPRLVWEWYEYRRRLIQDVQPNPAHYALRDLEDGFEEFLLVTQNIDGLHQRAGSRKIAELHGNIWRDRCLRCNRIYDHKQVDLGEIPPKCACGGTLRPDVVWFGESLPQEALSQAFQAARSCDLLLTVGTSALVQPAASLPLLALRNGAFVVEINPEPTPISEEVNESIRGEGRRGSPSLSEKAMAHHR